MNLRFIRHTINTFVSLLRCVVLLVAVVSIIAHGTQLEAQNLENRTFERDRSLLDDTGDGSRFVGGDTSSKPDFEIFSRLDSLTIHHRDEKVALTSGINDHVGLAPDTVADLDSFLGMSVSWSDLEQIKSIIQKNLLETQSMLTRVIIPEQEVTGGKLRFEVVISRVGEIDSGSDPRIVEWLQISEGETVDRWNIEDQLEFINRNPARTAGLVYRPGEDFGTTDIHVLLDDEDPWRISHSYDNYGVDLLGPDNYGITIEHGDLFRRDVRFLYNYTGALEFDSLHAHFASLTLPFHRKRHELAWSGYYSDVRTDIPIGAGATLLSKGESWQSTLDYRVQLPRAFNRKLKQEIYTGFESKGSSGNLEFGLVDLAPTNTEIYQFHFGYLAQWKDKTGSNAFRAVLTASPGGWTPQNNDAAFNLSRFGAESSYSYFEIGFERNQDLPRNLVLHTEIGAQAASDNLLASEQLSLSGPYATRGFEPSVVRADHGVFMQAELLFPGIIVPTLPWQAGTLGNAIQPYGFFDWAWGGSHSPLPGEREVSLASVGLGFQFLIANSVRGDLHYGWQVGENGFVDGDSGRLNALVTLGW